MEEAGFVLADKILKAARTELQGNIVALARLDHLTTDDVHKLIDARIVEKLGTGPPFAPDGSNMTESVLGESVESLITAVVQAVIARVTLDD